MKSPPGPRDGVPASRLQLVQGPWSTVLEALCARFPAVAAATWEERMRRGLVLDGAGRGITPATAHAVGMEVYYYREIGQEPVIPFQATVLHVDAHVVVADKPHFLPVAPVGEYARETLLARLVRDLGLPGLVPLHRLDRDTAGLVLFSANPATRAQYHALFSERRIDKAYEALAPPLRGMTLPLVRRSRIERGDPFFRMREVAGEANSETRIQVLEDHGSCWRYGLQPITGRKHQLRVHMAALGAPIEGDRLYPELEEQAAGDHRRPLRLLARSLSYRDPVDGRDRCYVSRREL